MILPLAILCRVRASVVNRLVDKFLFLSQELSKLCLATGIRSAAEISSSTWCCLDWELFISLVLRENLIPN